MLSKKYNRYICYYSLLILLKCKAIEGSESASSEVGRRIAIDNPNKRSRESVPLIRRDEEIDNGGMNVGMDMDMDMHFHADETRERNLIGDFENCWVQLGNDLSAAESYLAVGSSVDISSIDSSTKTVTIATGAYDNAMVFDYALGDGDVYDGEWTQLGDIVPGKQQYDEFGQSISISSNGRVVAVGAPSYNAVNRTNVGYVRVYGYGLGSGSALASWSRIGQDIDGYTRGERFGHSVSLSDDGLTVVIGTDHFERGSSRIFRYNEQNDEKWYLSGEIEGTSRNDGKESSTSISGDGKTIAIGAPFDKKTRIFQYQVSSQNWTQIGADIVSESQKLDGSGYSVSLSSNGTIVAIGAHKYGGNNGIASGRVRVYSFSGTMWEQLGGGIEGESATDYSGCWVSLSDDGFTVAIGAWSNDDNGPNAGHVRVYRYASNEWKQYGHDIDGSGGLDASGAALSLSPDGQLVAIGSRGYNSGAGHVRIFANTNANCTITSQPSSQPTDMPSDSRFPSAVPSYQLSQAPSKSLTQSPMERIARGPEPTTPSQPVSPVLNEASKRSIWACVLTFVMGIAMMHV